MNGRGLNLPRLGNNLGADIDASPVSDNGAQDGSRRPYPLDGARRDGCHTSGVHVGLSPGNRERVRVRGHRTTLLGERRTQQIRHSLTEVRE